MQHVFHCGCGRAHIVDGPLSVELDPGETRMVLAAMAKPVVTRDDLRDALWPDSETMPDYWVEGLKVRLSRLRQKIIPFGFNIVFASGHGNTHYQVSHYRVAWRMAR